MDLEKLIKGAIGVTAAVGVIVGGIYISRDYEKFREEKAQVNDWRNLLGDTPDDSFETYILEKIERLENDPYFIAGMSGDNITEVSEIGEERGKFSKLLHYTLGVLANDYLSKAEETEPTQDAPTDESPAPEDGRVVNEEPIAEEQVVIVIDELHREDNRPYGQVLMLNEGSRTYASILRNEYKLGKELIPENDADMSETYLNNVIKGVFGTVRRLYNDNERISVTDILPDILDNMGRLLTNLVMFKSSEYNTTYDEFERNLTSANEFSNEVGEYGTARDLYGQLYQKLDDIELNND
jgi:hypothetical protein